MKKLLLILSFLFISDACYALTWADLNFNNASRIHERRSDNSHFYIWDDNQEFWTFTQGETGDWAFPWITPSVDYEGGKAIGFWTKQDTDGIKERSEIILTAPGYNQSYKLKFKRIRYVGLRFQVRPQVPALPNDEHVVILQAVQYGHQYNDGPKAVPFVVWLKGPDANGFPQIKVDISGEDGYSSTSWIQIEMRRWYKLVVMLEPRWEYEYNPPLDGKGVVRVKLDDSYIHNERRYWGYEPIGDVVDSWRISTGIYRPGPGLGDCVIVMDNIKVGSSWEDADPDY